jgi:lactoylglutathione lyase
MTTTATATNVQQAVPFFWVHDIQRSIHFYVEGLGFTITNQWIDAGKLRWCWLQLGGVAVMLQEFWTDGHHRNLADGKLGTGVSIWFICKDALALWREFLSRGLSARRPFVGNGMWVTQVSDPDGYDLYFESATDAPEETVYSGDRELQPRPGGDAGDAGPTLPTQKPHSGPGISAGVQDRDAAGLGGPPGT